MEGEGIKKRDRGREIGIGNGGGLGEEREWVGEFLAQALSPFGVVRVRVQPPSITGGA